MATDRNRNLFLKGFKLSNSGGNEDPTYLGFKVMFDFGSLPISTEWGWAPSPLLKRDNYTNENSGMSNIQNSFSGQPQYQLSNPEVAYYSAYNYLIQRDAGFADNNQRKRANAILQFQSLLKDINTNSPWFFQSIEGLDQLSLVSKNGFQPSNEIDGFDTQRTGDKVLTFNTLESLNLRISALADLYNQATFDFDNMRWLVPRNLRKFTMWIFVTEIRNFFKTSRLTASSTALTALNDLGGLINSNTNPGGSIISSFGGLAGSDFDRSAGSDSGGGGGSFSSSVGNVLDQSGLSNDFAAFTNQQDQSGIKPVKIYECQQCEFDFSESVPYKSSIDMGSSSADPETNSFKVHVGKVRVKSQYPNIRGDKKPLILADGYDQNSSSLEELGDSSLDLEKLLGLGGQLLTNAVSNVVNDLVNEGVSALTSNLDGLDQSLLGNIYSLNPSQLGRLTNDGGRFGFNNLENFLNGAAETGIDNIFKGNLPNPQTTGEGGPPERVYPPIQGVKDEYPNVPGTDLGVPDRVYPEPSGDAYANVPGTDLGVPDRVYPEPSGDAYANVPGTDLGVPDRVYQDPEGDAYPDVPGADLGVPDRVYQDPAGDAYPDVPGADLGVPDRVYQEPSGDAYPDVPGADLGVPDRVYPDFGDDVYPDVPGADLGVPDRVYPDFGDDVYPDVPGADLGVPDRNYDSLSSDDVYSGVPGSDLGVPDRKYANFNDRVYEDKYSNELLQPDSVYDEVNLVSSRGEIRSPENNFSQPPGKVYQEVRVNYPEGNIGKVYPVTNGDFIVDPPLNLGNTKPPDKYNVSLGGFNPDEDEI
jgi:hypothetical protein